MSVKIGAISVGGRGTRFKADTMQKCLFPIDRKPILEYTIELFLKMGITTVYLLAGFRGKQVKKYVMWRNEKIGTTITVIDGGANGQIPALLTLRTLVNEDFLYAGGDCILHKGVIENLIQTADEHPDCIATMAASTCNEFMESHPLIALEDGSSLIKNVYAPDSGFPTDLTGMGVYHFRPSAFAILEQTKVNSSAPTAEFVDVAHKAGLRVAASVTDLPSFCLHFPEDVNLWRHSKLRKLLQIN